MQNLVFVPKKNWFGKTHFLWKGSDKLNYSGNLANAIIYIGGTNNSFPIVKNIKKFVKENEVLMFK